MKFKQRGREEQAEADGSFVCNKFSRKVCFGSALLCYTLLNMQILRNQKKKFQSRLQQIKIKIQQTLLHYQSLRLWNSAIILHKLILAKI